MFPLAMMQVENRGIARPVMMAAPRGSGGVMGEKFVVKIRQNGEERDLKITAPDRVNAEIAAKATGERVLVLATRPFRIGFAA